MPGLLDYRPDPRAPYMPPAPDQPTSLLGMAGGAASSAYSDWGALLRQQMGPGLLEQMTGSQADLHAALAAAGTDAERQAAWQAYGQDPRLLNIAGGLLDVMAPIKAYHGTPHVFPRFDISKIGTGEGAQVFGHGLYFAENPAIAQHYRDSLAGTSPTMWYKNEPYRQFQENPNASQMELDALRNLRNWQGDPVKAAAWADRRVASFEKGMAEPDASPEHVEYWGDEAERLRQMAAWLRDPENLKNIRTEKPGAFYEVTLAPDPEDLLHLDKKLSEQSPKVQDLLGVSVDAHEGKIASLQDEIGKIQKEMSAMSDLPAETYNHDKYLDLQARRAELEHQQLVLENLHPAETSGHDYYRHLSWVLGGGPKASQDLLNRGVPGVRYLDASSRNAGEGSHNVVMFSDEPIAIDRINQQPPEAYFPPGLLGPMGR